MAAPPPYDMGGPVAQKMGEPEGDPELVRYCQEKFPKLNIRKVAKVTPNDAQKLTWNRCAFIFLCPCFWPHAIICSPCILATCATAKKNLLNTVYMLTDDSVVIHVTDHTPPMCQCGTTGKDYQSINLKHMQRISVDDKGKGCCQCVAAPTIDIFTSADRMGGKHGNQRIPNNLFVGDAVHEWHDTISEVAKACEAAQQRVVVVQQAAPVQAAVAKRVFVAKESTPGDMKIVMLDGTMGSFLESVAVTLSLQPGRIELKLHEVGVAVTAVDQISANDKLVVTGV